MTAADEHEVDKFVGSKAWFDCGTLDLRNESYHYVRQVRWDLEAKAIVEMDVSLNDSSIQIDVKNKNTTHYLIDKINGSLAVQSLLNGHAGQYHCLITDEVTDTVEEAAYRLHVYGTQNQTDLANILIFIRIFCL